ncbi:MAG TPA: hypothetical protein VFJ16_21290 [Longimicrobium sp.]|nr:hypothetical protein [Longimicrobium sp.]
MAVFPRVVHPLSILLLAGVVACRGGAREGGGRSTSDGGGADSAQAARTLSAADQEALYHLGEGSELIIPLNVARALRSVATGKPFFEDPERFGLVTDPRSPERLPIGVTGDYTLDTRFTGTRMLGFNCSACHVNQITYQGKAVRLDGAPARFFADSLQHELLADLKHTATNWDAFWRFLKDLRAIERGGVPRAGESGLAQAEELFARLDDRDTTEAERAFVAGLRRALAEDSLRNPAVNLWDVPWDSASAAHRALRERYRDQGAHDAAARMLQRLLPEHRRELMGAAAANDASTVPQAQSIHDWIVVLRLLRDRIASLPHQQPAILTVGGPGRVDAFGVARNKIYPRNTVPTNAPVSYPFLWGFGHTAWLHYDANTNSVMERNLGQALGVGAVWDPRTFQSTLNPRNLHRLEMITRTLTAPAWPAAFPPIDEAKAGEGRAIFVQQCAGCHQPESSADVCYRLSDVGTDSLRPINFALAEGRGNFTDSVAPVLHQLKVQAYKLFKIPADSQMILNGGLPDSQVVWRTTRMWGVRPLDGVWATAPYLHNGSVPTLYELLLPPGRRSRRFSLGQSEYDPVHVGYSTAARGIWTFDASLPGNDNGGHTYGTQLSEPERMALLEYLKTLGGGGTPSAPQSSAGVRCPSRWQPRAR